MPCILMRLKTQAALAAFQQVVYNSIKIQSQFISKEIVSLI